MASEAISLPEGSGIAVGANWHDAPTPRLARDGHQRSTRASTGVGATVVGQGLLPWKKPMLGTASWFTPSRVLLIALAAEMSSPCRTPDPAKLVVGVQSEPMGGVVSAFTS